MATTAVTFRFDARQATNKLTAAAAAFAGRLTGQQADGYERAGRIHLQYLAERFDAYSGGAGDWAPLTELTVAEKQGDNRILIRTGRLRASLEPGGPGNVLRVTASGVEVGTTDPTAPFHQQGTSRMPARRIVVPPPPDVRLRMAAAVKAGAVELLKGIFGR